MNEPEFLTVSQAAEAFNATSQTVRNWIRTDKLRARRVGNRFLIPREEVERLRGDLPTLSGESPWDHTADQPAEPLPRKRSGPEPDTGGRDSWLGA
jgi:excisionase family DNA binding protein